MDEERKKEIVAEYRHLLLTHAAGAADNICQKYGIDKVALEAMVADIGLMTSETQPVEPEISPEVEKKDDDPDDESTQGAA